MHVEEEEFEFQSFVNGDCIGKLSITTDEYQIGKEGGFYYDPNPPANDTEKRTKSNINSSISSSDLEESSIANRSNSTAVASDSSGGVKLIHRSPKATFSEFEPINQLLETADNNIKGGGCSEDDEEGKAAVDDTAAAAQSRPKISFQIVNPKLNKKKKDMKSKANNVTHQQEQKSKLIEEEEESFDFTTINDKDFITSWMTMQK
jgi:hypothetical protein